MAITGQSKDLRAQRPPGCLYFHPSKPRFSWTELSNGGFAKIQGKNDSDNSEYLGIIKVTITIFEARQMIKSQ